MVSSCPCVYPPSKFQNNWWISIYPGTNILLQDGELPLSFCFPAISDLSWLNEIYI
jgi:hypothetical protein